MRTDIDSSLKFFRLCDELKISKAECLFMLYRLASWFRTHGKHGKMSERHIVAIDFYLNVAGATKALKAIGWIEVSNGWVMLKEFSDVSSIRKSLGKQIRSKVLANASCVACGSASDLVVDHLVPICRGGTSEPENLQPLCRSCNSRKGRRTMEEWNG
jgi:hypothetical protein